MEELKTSLKELSDRIFAIEKRVGILYTFLLILMAGQFGLSLDGVLQIHSVVNTLSSSEFKKASCSPIYVEGTGK